MQSFTIPPEPSPARVNQEHLEAIEAIQLLSYGNFVAR